MTILSFLLENKTAVLIFILISIIGVQYAYTSTVKSKNNQLIAEKETVKTQLEASQASVKQLQSDIDTQNKAVDQFKKDADIRAAKNAAEVKVANEKALVHKSHAEELLKLVSPQNMSKCDAANMIINQEIKNATK